MKFTKILGLMAVAVAALMAFAATASATTLTSPSGTTYTSTIKASSEGATSLEGAFVTVTCQKSNVEGKVEKHGSGVTAGGNISTLTFTECNFPTTVVKKGSLEIHSAGSGNGTLTGSGSEISIETSLGTCVFTTSSTKLGTLTGSTSKNATLDIESAAIPRTGGSFLCGSSGTWTGSYSVTTPSTLTVDA
jgi:hypothetical protein